MNGVGGFGDGRVTGSPASASAICPFCDRTEIMPVQHSVAARAWLVGHIQTEHADRLPAFEGVEHTDADEVIR